MSLSVWRYRRIHISFILGWLALGIMIGIALGKSFPVLTSWVWLVVGISLLPVVIRQRRWWSVGFAIFAGMLIGGQRGSTETIALSGHQSYIGRVVHLSGTISDDPQVSERSQTQFSLGSVAVDGHRIKGRMYVSVAGKKEFKRGDHVVLSGKLQTGFGSYQATMRYADVMAINSGASPIRDVREHFSQGVREVVPEPESSLGVGFVVGQRSSLPPELDEQLKMVGLTHIVVASGYNLTILVRFARRLLAKYSRYAALIVSMTMVIGFIAFSGLTPSMTRAGAVTILSLLAWYYGRRFHPLLLIAYVAAATAYVDPIYLWSDIGWYLSFLAFIGVLIVSPLMIARLYKDKRPSAVTQLMIETIAASIMTLPLILFTFGQLPTLSLVANVFVAPFIPFAMLATTVAGAAGMIAPTLLAWTGLPATIVIGYVVAVVEFLSSIEWARYDIALPALAMIAAYVAICVVLFVWWKRTNHKFLARSIVE